MANSKSAAGFRSSVIVGKQSLLPPKSPAPIPSPSAGFGHCNASKGLGRVGDGQRHHQRTTSESFLVEEQPSWLDELLDEPETPVRKPTHRRSSSDSFAYVDVGGRHSYAQCFAMEEQQYRGVSMLPAWGSQDLECPRDVHQHTSSYFTEMNSHGMSQNRGWESSRNITAYQRSPLVSKERTSQHDPFSVMKESHDGASGVDGKQYQDEGNLDFSERRDGSHPKQPQSEVDPKRVKQQFAQRSRVRKLQYIAELERNVQALQAEEMEIAAQLEFLDRQNLILSLENKTLKQRLENVAEEHLIKRLQQEMLECEISRLRSLYQQQQKQPQQQSVPAHARSSSRDLDSQLADLSLKHSEVSSSREPVISSLHI